jgi:hypothetical protein
MFGRGSFFVRLLGLLILAALLFAGGTLIYRAGYSQGLVESPAMAQAMSNAFESGQLPFYPGYRYVPLPGLWPGYGFSPFALFLGLFFFGLLALFALRLVFRPRFRGPWGHWGRHPAYAYGGPGKGPQGEWPAWKGHWQWMPDGEGAPASEAGQEGAESRSQPLDPSG